MMVHLHDSLVFRGFRALLLHLTVLPLLLAKTAGQHQVVGPSQPIVATVGDDITLPCHLRPAKTVSDMTVEWARPDLNPRFVHVWRDGVELESKKHPSYKGRTSVSIDKLKLGDISLTLSRVKLSDGGQYKCLIPGLGQSLIQLVVGAVSPPFIVSINITSSEVALQCECAGWYPEPEVLWLDGEGKLLSAGPTETVRGPDDLYTVSSRVTVEKRHSDSFTCRVQQRNINQTRETHIQVPDDFFKVQSSSSIIIGLAVSLTVCIMLIVLLLILLWKWRQNIIKTKRRYCGEIDRGYKKNSSKTSKTEDQSVRDEEREHLMTAETVEMKDLKENGEKKSKHIKKQRSQQQLLEEQQRREVEMEVQTLKEELETKKKEVETKQCELQQLNEEKQRNEDELQTLKEELENKNKEKREEVEKEVETLKKQLETKQMELDSKIKKIDEKQAEVQQLQNQIQRVSNLQTLVETLSKNMELEDKEQAAEMEWKKKYDMLMENKHEDIHLFKRHIDQLLADVKKLKEEKQRIKNERQQLQKELERNKQAAEKELKEAQHQLKNKNTEISELKRDLQHGEREVEKVERLMKELADRNIEWQKKLKDERTRKEAAEREVEALKKELKTKPKTNESVPVQLGASSPTEPVTMPDVNSLPNTSV